MWSSGAISHETLLNTLKRGEVLTEELDVEAEIELIESSKLIDLDIGAAAGIPDDEEEEEPAKEEDSEVRKQVAERLRKQLEINDEDDG